jgi:V/A-type H+-transporting ATPase subunit F
MYKIAVMGDRDSILGFQALGLEVFPQEDVSEARRTLHRLAHSDYAVIYMTEQLAAQLTSDIDRYKDSVTPAIILIPGRSGSLGIGSSALQSAVERAVGADIL